MTEQTTAAMWASDMAELTGCDETVWLSVGMSLPEGTPGGEPLLLQFPGAAERENLTLRLKGGMAGYRMYAVPIAPGVTAPWVCRGLLLTDDPGAAAWFARLPGAGQGEALGSSGQFLRVLHLSHSSGRALAALPEEHTLWALGADVPSLCRGVALGLGCYEGRWGDWLAVPMELRGGLGVLCPEGAPRWLQIGPDGGLWAADPWSAEPPTAALTGLLVALPGVISGVCRVEWPMLALLTALALRGETGAAAWYYDRLPHYVNQWAHTWDVVPRPPLCFAGDPDAAGVEAWIQGNAAEPSGEAGAVGWPMPGAAVDTARLAALARGLGVQLGGTMGGLAQPLMQRLERLEKLDETAPEKISG